MTRNVKSLPLIVLAAALFLCTFSSRAECFNCPSYDCHGPGSCGGGCECSRPPTGGGAGRCVSLAIQTEEG